MKGFPWHPHGVIETITYVIHGRVREGDVPEISLLPLCDRRSLTSVFLLSIYCHPGHNVPVSTSPNRIKGEAAAAKLRRQGANVTYYLLDVTNERQIRALRTFVFRNFGRVDVLVNNAGVLLDEGRSKLEGLMARRLKKPPKRVDVGEGPSVLAVDLDVVRVTLEINTLGPLLMCQTFVPPMMKSGYGRVVNVSSSRGQLNGMTDGGAPAYQMSKAALNAVTLMVADAVRGGNVLVNSVCPGWTRTNLGGPEAPRSVEEAAETILWLATLPDAGPTGGFFTDKKTIDW